MSKNLKKPAFKYTIQHSLPKLGKIKTEWDLKKFYYASENDPQIEKDVQVTEKHYRAFAKKYRGSDFCENSQTLLAALDRLEEIKLFPSTRKPTRYFFLRTALDSKDTTAQKRINVLGDRLTKASNELLFFELELGKVSKAQQKKFLADKKLAPYRYYLERVFLEARYDLSEAEEKILRLDSGPSYEMWVDATERMLGNRTITYKKMTMGLSEAIEHLDTLPSSQKPVLWDIIMTEMEKLSEVVENELTAIATSKKVSDELRGYKKPYSATALNYEDDEKSIEALVDAVSTKGFQLSRKFYSLKAKLHGVDSLHYSQKYDSIGESPEIPFEQAVEICRDVFYGVKNEYGQIFDTMLTSGQIDVYPKKGKRGGAFMSEAIAQPTHVFLNHTSTFKSLETLAHEMGHAIHAERSKLQPPRYQGHSITTAETASTLFENLVFDAIFEQTPEKEKTYLLHDRLTRDIATIQRQIAFFNFELDMHQHVRREGAVTKEELNAYMQKHLKSYLGKGVRVDETDGHSYVYVPHFRYGFYVYTYSFGILISSMMANHYREDRSYLKEIDGFLCAGESADVKTIFKTIGIDTTKRATFELGLDEFGRHLKTLEKLTQK